MRMEYISATEIAHTITITFVKFTYTCVTYVEFKQAYGQTS